MNEQQAKIVEVIQVTTPCPPNTMGLDQVEYYTKEGRNIGHEMPPHPPAGQPTTQRMVAIPHSDYVDLLSDREMLEWLVAESAYCVHRGSGVGYAVIKTTTGGLRQVGVEYQDWRKAIRSAMEATANDI